MTTTVTATTATTAIASTMTSTTTARETTATTATGVNVADVVTAAADAWTTLEVSEWDTCISIESCLAQRRRLGWHSGRREPQSKSAIEVNPQSKSAIEVNSCIPSNTDGPGAFGNDICCVCEPVSAASLQHTQSRV